MGATQGVDGFVTAACTATELFVAETGFYDGTLFANVPFYEHHLGN